MRPVFAFMPAIGSPASETLLLARSIRRFAGALASAPIWVMNPVGDSADSGNPLGYAERREIESLGAVVRDFHSGQEAWGFPFAAKVYAAAEAEAAAAQEADILVWMDSDTLVVSEPKEFALQRGKDLGFLPVQLALIGSRCDQPVDAFWTWVYEQCGTPAEAAWPVRTVVDRIDVRAYINAGLLVVRPQRGILRGWRDNFSKVYRVPESEAFYRDKPLYRIFIHQAVLAATVLGLLSQDEAVQLPPTYNYALHLLDRYPEQDRLPRLNDAVTCRYDEFSFLQSLERQPMVRVDEPLRSWLLAAIQRA